MSRVLDFNTTEILGAGGYTEFMNGYLGDYPIKTAHSIGYA